MAFRNAAERTIALNRDGRRTRRRIIGLLMAYAGDWERGCALAESARQLNPHHPGWYWLAAIFDAYRKRDYRARARRSPSRSTCPATSMRAR